METLPILELGKMQKLFEDSGIIGFGDPLETKKFSEDSMLFYSKFINIVFQCTSTYNASLLAKSFQSDLWSVFFRVFGRPFDIPSTCQKDFIDYCDKKLYTNV